MPVLTRHSRRSLGLTAPTLPREQSKPRAPRRSVPAATSPSKASAPPKPPVPRTSARLASRRKPPPIAIKVIPERSPSPLTPLASSTSSTFTFHADDARSTYSHSSDATTIYDTSQHAVPSHPALQRMVQKPCHVRRGWDFLVDRSGESLHLHQTRSLASESSVGDGRWVDQDRGRGTRSPSPHPSIIRIYYPPTPVVEQPCGVRTRSSTRNASL
uniref:Uncharacterized protein n=1 Tax=Mycena chlorophos TaxID=658473 RepID=A0ABQ0L5T7_MYCCL|nr:predicted protein [Mycena chlorophos]